METAHVNAKTWELSLYELHRSPHEVKTDDLEINVLPRSLHSELMCPICLDVLKNTMTTKECLHRFCQECIITALRSGNKECPTCRKKLVSKRSLRPDPNFDALISKIFPSRDEYDAHQDRVLAQIKQTMVKCMEEGHHQQALNRAKARKSCVESLSNRGGQSHTSGYIERPSDVSVLSNITNSGGSVFSGQSTLSLSSEEVEVVMLPHPDTDCAESHSRTRYLKTTANATVEHMSKYLGIRATLESKDTSNPFPTEDIQYSIFPTSPSKSGEFSRLSGNLSLAEVSELLGKSGQPLQLFYLVEISSPKDVLD